MRVCASDACGVALPSRFALVAQGRPGGQDAPRSAGAPSAVLMFRRGEDGELPVRSRRICPVPSVLGSATASLGGEGVLRKKREFPALPDEAGDVPSEFYRSTASLQQAEQPGQPGHPPCCCVCLPEPEPKPSLSTRGFFRWCGGMKLIF